MQKENLVELSGTVETVVYKNEESGFAVLELDHDGELVTVVGELASVGEGEMLTLHGSFRTHPNYGTQFKAVAAQQRLPASASAILRYLSSGAIKGIGPVLASRMVAQFGDDTLQVLEHEPERLREVKGITEAKCEKLRTELSRMFGMRAVMLFLSQFGVSSSTSVAIWKRWGTLSQKMIEENPYLLCCDEIGMDFDSCEMIARKLNIPPDSSYRIEAALQFVLRHNLYNGHTCLPVDKLLPTAERLLDQSCIMVEKGLEELLRRREVLVVDVNGRDYCYLPEYLEAERFIASRVRFLLAAGADPIPQAEQKLEQLEQSGGIQYAALQREAILQALTYRLFILTGGPGTGKTTTINAIIDLLEEAGLKVSLCAPTGRAAKRMSEVTGREAKTIHRLLEVDFANPTSLQFKRNEKNPLTADAVIVDETSMVDIPLMRSLICALKMNCRLILVGDSDQLPSVGPGNVLRDLIQSEKVPQVRLTEIFRQAQKSRIVMSAHAINQGKFPDTSNGRDTDFFFMKEDDPEKAAATIVRLVKERLPRAYGERPEHIQVLTPMQRGIVGAANLNLALQEALNPSGPGLSRGGYTYRQGDRVMQLRNNYDKEVFNGDLGYIREVDTEDRTRMVDFDGKSVEYDVTELDELTLAYATTIHKAQGSEYPIVVMPVLMTHFVMLQRNLIYTGITRAKKICVLIGAAKALACAIRNMAVLKRNTMLKERIAGDLR